MCTQTDNLTNNRPLLRHPAKKQMRPIIWIPGSTWCTHVDRTTNIVTGVSTGYTITYSIYSHCIHQKNKKGDAFETSVY